MKCWKCTNPAVVHLTDLLSESDGRKRCVEVHLCMTHARESGFLAHLPTPHEAQPQPAKKQAVPEAAAKPGPTIIKPTSTAQPAAIVPAQPVGGLSVVRRELIAEVPACPVCGITYQQIKNSGLMGCPHDYAFFESRLLPLIQRQEGAAQHAGKVPTHVRDTAPSRTITMARLRRELDHALTLENYERAAQLRDQLKQLTAP